MVFTTVTAGQLTCLSPRCVSAEHSMYLTARTLFASFCPCSLLIGDKPCSARALRVSRSSLRSIFVPENKHGNFNLKQLLSCDN